MTALILALAALVVAGVAILAATVGRAYARCALCDQDALPGPSRLCLDHLTDPR